MAQNSFSGKPKAPARWQGQRAGAFGLPLNGVAVMVALLGALSCVGAEPERFAKIDAAVEKSIAAGEMPGCVVLVLHKDEVVYRKAFGLRAKQPAEEKMEPGTIFDLASLTKPIATATLIGKLIEG